MCEFRKKLREVRVMVPWNTANLDAMSGNAIPSERDVLAEPFLLSRSDYRNRPEIFWGSILANSLAV
jgi:hypothetical protein